MDFINKMGSRLYDLFKHDDITLTYSEIESSGWTDEFKMSVHETKRKSLWR